MAALDTPWLNSMSPSSTYRSEDGLPAPQPSYDPNPPTIAAFSPNTLSGSSSISKQRSTVIVHKKSPLLVATPPQITRALAYSHPFLLPLNKLAGLLSWSTEDPWESFILVASFWGFTLYGGSIIRYAGPVIIVVLLILGIYSRRYSPLSSTSQTGEKHEPKAHKREPSESSMKHHKSLDEIVETLRQFTTRCNLLLDPFLCMTDFLSTQRTATSATTRPALTTLFIRILIVTPFWIGLTLAPFRVLTTRRIVLMIGTVMLTWHSRPARVSRVILWRSVAIRRLSSFITGLSFSTDTTKASGGSLLKPPLPPRRKSQANLASEIATKRRPDSSGVRFTFVLYENQRRWIGLGWTISLFAYERGPWTDEQLNPAPAKDNFELPDVESGAARWRWLDGSSWKLEDVDGRIIVPQGKPSSEAAEGQGWIYYDNKWNEGRKDDGWGRYTRRRKWFRDAELVEITPSTEVTPSPTPDREGLSEAEGGFASSGSRSVKTSEFGTDGQAETEGEEGKSKTPKKGWFGKNRDRSDSKNSSGKNTGKDSAGSGVLSIRSDRSRDGPDDDHVDSWRAGQREEFGFVDEAKMGLG